jgi:hypothetical protein
MARAVPVTGRPLTPGPSPPKRGRGEYRQSVLAAVGLAGLIRIAAATGDLYIDEIWSWWFVRNVTKRFVDLLALRHDNNHLLNTMIMYVLGTDVPGMWYRIPAVLASIGTVWLAGSIAGRHGGFAAQVTTWLLVGGSYLLILYGSEARGYSYAIFFALLSWEFLQRAAETRRWGDAAVFSLSCCLGFLAHLTFVYCYAGFCVWTVWTWWRKPAWALSVAHLLPMLTAAWLQLFFIGGLFSPKMAIGGGPETDLFAAVISTLSLIAGGPLTGDGTLVAALSVLILIGVGLVELWRQDRAVCVCYLTIIVLAPAAVLMLTGHALIYPRYFLAPVSFALLAIGQGVSRWWRASATGRIGLISVLAVSAALNGWWTIRLLDHGRGDYLQALKWLTSQVPDGPIVVSSDHDFRNGMIVSYYAPRLGPSASRWQYVEQRFLPPEGTPWVLLHDFEGDAPYPDVVTDRYGKPYRLERAFRHQSLSGYNWWVYRRASP